jgi:hypothetical protein
MRNSFGISDTLTEAEFSSTAEAFTTVEVVNIQVFNITPGNRFIIKQLMFECDGNLVKLPFINFSNG